MAHVRVLLLELGELGLHIHYEAIQSDPGQGSQVLDRIQLNGGGPGPRRPSTSGSVGSIEGRLPSLGLPQCLNSRRQSRLMTLRLRERLPIKPP